jgi:hypothetical protein
MRHLRRSINRIVVHRHLYVRHTHILECKSVTAAVIDYKTLSDIVLNHQGLEQLWWGLGDGAWGQVG